MALIMQARAVLEVNLSAIKHNVRLLNTGQGFFCPMLKANAYGHGAVPIAKALYEEGVKQVGVINTDEAWSIRENCPELDILIFSPLLNSNDLDWIIQEKIVLVCSDWKDLKALSKLKTKARIHLKFDTGFSRLGFLPEEATQILAFLKDHSHIELEGIGSQLLSGGELADTNSPTHKQLQSFLKLQKLFPNKKNHLLNSSALISCYVNSLDYAKGLGYRPGISLYGIKPEVSLKTKSAQAQWQKWDLIPSGCLKSQIIALRTIPKGTAVSYNSLWVAKEKTLIATISLGYADGFSRSVDAQPRYVLFRGQKRPIVGAVGMDFFMIALKKEDQNTQRGEELILFGHPDLTVQEQAQAVGTIPYELFVSLGSRVERVYKKD